eukprot:245241-Alexandrium_andersonii.AAC.1
MLPTPSATSALRAALSPARVSHQPVLSEPLTARYNCRAYFCIARFDTQSGLPARKNPTTLPLKSSSQNVH